MDELDSNGADILIGTPGRTMDMLSRCRLVDLRKVEVKYMCFIECWDSYI